MRELAVKVEALFTPPGFLSRRRFAGNQGAKKKALPEIERGMSLEFGILHRVSRSDASPS
jgi:hypothetical protein